MDRSIFLSNYLLLTLTLLRKIQEYHMIVGASLVYYLNEKQQQQQQQKFKYPNNNERYFMY